MRAKTQENEVEGEREKRHLCQGRQRQKRRERGAARDKRGQLRRHASKKREKLQVTVLPTLMLDQANELDQIKRKY